VSIQVSATTCSITVGSITAQFRLNARLGSRLRISFWGFTFPNPSVDRLRNPFKTDPRNGLSYWPENSSKSVSQTDAYETHSNTPRLFELVYSSISVSPLVEPFHSNAKLLVSSSCHLFPDLPVFRAWTRHQPMRLNLHVFSPSPRPHSRLIPQLHRLIPTPFVFTTIPLPQF
jgi:hypothetical protein